MTFKEWCNYHGVMHPDQWRTQEMTHTEYIEYYLVTLTRYIESRLEKP